MTASMIVATVVHVKRWMTHHEGACPSREHVSTADLEELLLLIKLGEKGDAAVLSRHHEDRGPSRLRGRLHEDRLPSLRGEVWGKVEDGHAPLCILRPVLGQELARLALLNTGEISLEIGKVLLFVCPILIGHKSREPKVCVKRGGQSSEAFVLN